jgi:hypothetical protein
MELTKDGNRMTLVLALSYSFVVAGTQPRPRSMVDVLAVISAY